MTFRRNDLRLIAEACRRASETAQAHVAATTGPPAPDTFFEWAGRIPEPKTGPLDFDSFPYQRELYREGVELPEIDVMKSTQVGASAWLVRSVIYWVDRGDTGLYVFPADEQLRSFYNSRIAPLLRTPYLAKRVENASVSNVHQREIGRVGDKSGGCHAG